MKNIMLVCYTHRGCEPLRSITRLSKDEAFAQAKKLSDANSGTAFRRFGSDFTAYYNHRILAEEWLLDGFTAIGGKPRTKHPLYFVLNGSSVLKEWFDGGYEIVLPLSIISPSHISFTYGDSMSKLNRPERRPVFGTEELMRHIADAGGTDEFISQIQADYTYIEAQLWSDEYLPHARRKDENYAES